MLLHLGLVVSLTNLSAKVSIRKLGGLGQKNSTPNTLLGGFYIELLFFNSKTNILKYRQRAKYRGERLV